MHMSSFTVAVKLYGKYSSQRLLKESTVVPLLDGVGSTSWPSVEEAKVWGQAGAKVLCHFILGE